MNHAFQLVAVLADEWSDGLNQLKLTKVAIHNLVGDILIRAGKLIFLALWEIYAHTLSHTFNM
jgi:hypothetical protein